MKHSTKNLIRSKWEGEEEAFGVNEDGKRTQPGVVRPLRKAKNGEAYGYLDPDSLASLAEPPAHVQAAMDDVFGDWAKDEWGETRLKLRVHPHMHRWCLYEREYRPEVGQTLWRCFYIFQTDPIKGRLPSDFDGDPYLAHFTGKIGEYLEPDKSHFEILEKFNIHKYGYEAVNETAGELEEKEEAEAEQRMHEMEQAFVDENWFLAWDEANQRAGSGQYMRSTHCMNWQYKSNLTRYRRVEKNGYTVIEKKDADEYYAEVDAEIKRFTIEWNAARGLRQKWKPTDEELVEIFAKSNLIPHEMTAQQIKRIMAKTFEKDFKERFVESADEAEVTERKLAIETLRNKALKAKMIKEAL